MLFVIDEGTSSLVLKTFESPVHVSFVPAQQDLEGLHDAGTNLLQLPLSL